MKRVVLVLIAVLVLAGVGGGAFAAGTKVGENRAVQDPARFFQQRAGGQGGQFPGQFQTPQPGQFQTPPPGQRGAQGLGGGIMGTIDGSRAIRWWSALRRGRSACKRRIPP